MMAELILEMAGDICLDIAMAILLWNLICKSRRCIPGARLIAIAFGIGFAIGTVESGLRGLNVFIIPDALGFILSYTAFLFTFPGRKPEEPEQ